MGITSAPLAVPVNNPPAPGDNRGLLPAFCGGRARIDNWARRSKDRRKADSPGRDSARLVSGPMIGASALWIPQKPSDN